MPTKAELEADNKLLNKMLEAERDRANEWQEVAEQRAKTVKELQAELTFHIQKNPHTKRDWNKVLNNKAMYGWFLEYLEAGEGKESAYLAIYVRAVKKKWVKKVEATKAIRNIRRRLKKHYKRHNLEYPK